MTGPGREPAGAQRDPLSVGLGSQPPGDPGAEPDRTTERPAEPAPARERHTGKAIGRSLALALLIFVTVVLVLFVVFNGQSVQISLVFTDVEGPLVVALLVAAALGGLLVWLAGAVMRARRRKR
ncbi:MULTISPECIES: lipopolysaccharide assembly protein LapA domain-containing protein [unclassified Blastococcus]